MIKLKIETNTATYPVCIDTDFKGITKLLKSKSNSNTVAIITDKNVDKYYFNELNEILTNSDFKVLKYAIEPGEQSKNIEVVKDIYSFLIENKFDRNSRIIALGGGVTGDIAGFVASTFLRGVDFIQIPTSLLAQVDSSVGGKVGIDFNGMKNIIGAFYHPKFVYINVNTLKTLPEREIKSGLAEVVKHGMIKDSELFEYVEHNVDKIYNSHEDIMKHITKINCIIKGSIVNEDEKENGIRAILNFGHTIGHAIESVYEFKLSHGECVSLGMIGAIRIAKEYKLVDEIFENKIVDSFKKFKLPTGLTTLDTDKVMEMIMYDKKIKNNDIYFILPKSIGEVVKIKVKDKGIIQRAINSLISVDSKWT